MRELLGKVPARGPWNWRYSRNQNATLMLLTKTSKPHHQARGFDRARRCSPIGGYPCNQAEIST